MYLSEVKCDFVSMFDLLCGEDDGNVVLRVLRVVMM